MSIRIFIVLVTVIVTSSSFSSEKVESKYDNFENLELFNKVMYLIESNYYREVDQKKLIDGYNIIFVDDFNMFDDYPETAPPYGHYDLFAAVIEAKASKNSGNNTNSKIYVETS